MAAVAIVVVEASPGSLLRVEPEFSITAAALNVASRKKR